LAFFGECDRTGGFDICLRAGGSVDSSGAFGDVLRVVVDEQAEGDIVEVLGTGIVNEDTCPPPEGIKGASPAMF
jgi:hypothetical protein